MVTAMGVRSFPMLVVSIQIFHIVVVILVSGVKANVEIARVKAGPAHARDSHIESIDGQTCQRRAKLLLARTQIQHRGHEHVTAYARGTFQIQHFRHISIPVSLWHDR